MGRLFQPGSDGNSPGAEDHPTMENNKELYNSLVLDTYVKLIKEKYPDILIDDLMEYAGIENYEIGDSSVWFTQEQVNRFHKRLSMLTDNMKIAREAGRFAANPKCFGELRGMILSLGGIKNAFKLIEKYARRLTRSSTYTTRKAGRNTIEITVTPHEGVQEKEFQCQNRRGNFRGIADLFYYKNITITHPECLFKGDGACRYIVSWEESLVSVFHRLTWLSGFATAILFFLQQFAVADLVSETAVIVSLFVFMLLGWGTQKTKSHNLKHSLDEIYENKEELLKQIDINSENSRVIIDIGQALRIEQTDSNLFDRIAEITGRRLKYDRVMIMIANEDKTELVYSGGSGFTQKESPFLKRYRISLKDPSQGVFYESFKQGKPILVNKLKLLQERSTQRSFRLAKIMNPVAFISCPIPVDDTVIGIIVAGNIETPKKLGRNDKHLVMGVAQQIGSICHRQKYEAQRAELDKQLAQMQKMESLGVLAGGIAHDFNNILSPIVGYTDLCLGITPENEQSFRYLQGIRKASIRAQELVRQILTFSRQGEQENIWIQLTPIVKETLQLLRASIPSTIEIKKNILSKLRPIKADPTQIHQLVMNLCTNAYHAMKKEGGVLSVSLTEETIDSGRLVETLSLTPGPYIRLTVSDTGYGMNRAMLEKIFEPYFTTKEKGKGTGLGLAIAHGIVKQLNGHIAVKSRLTKGTCFDVYLPQIEDPREPVETITDKKMPKGMESILLVDDEQPLLMMLKELLQEIGYRVTAYNQSIQALGAFEQTPDAFDLVITDMTMPGITGAELARHILRINPEVPIILCTGYSDIINEQKAKAIGIKAFILKPIAISKLAVCIREILKKC